MTVALNCFLMCGLNPTFLLYICLICGIYLSVLSALIAFIFGSFMNLKHLSSEFDFEKKTGVLDLDICSVTFRLINIYAPNNDTPSFFHNIDNLILENSLDHSVICGDFNLVLNPQIDCCNYVSIKNPRSRSFLIESIRLHNLIDTFRYFYPQTQRYT